MKRKQYNIKPRPIILYLFVAALLCSVIARVAYIQNSDIALLASKADTSVTKLAESRGYIYDRNMQPLVNDTSFGLAAVIATAENTDLIKSLSNNNLDFENSSCLLTAQTNAAFANTNTAKYFNIVNRYSSNMLLSHIIGYTNSSGKGVCGLEKSYDAILSQAGGTLSISITANAKGKALAGAGISVEDKGYNSAAGLVLTVNKKIQLAAEEALSESEIKCGAVVVLSPATGEILALASVPEYDIFNLQASLNDSNKPFLNRALSAFPVGSVFKPFIAAAAIENNTLVPMYTCNGYNEVGDTRFHCYNHRAHGEQSLTEAVCNSCNAYFIELGLQTGAECVSSVCASLGFGSQTELTGDIVSSAGVLPAANDLQQAGQLANLCFGQGSLLATPLQLAAAYSALANGGTYIEPYILKLLVDKNQKGYAYYKTEKQYRVLSEQTCNQINEALHSNMLNGTGKNGNPNGFTACGKTATAQTGIYDENGNEQLCTWFAGFFPFEQPLYTVVVLNEYGTSASVDCAPVFKTLAEKIMYECSTD